MRVHALKLLKDQEIVFRSRVSYVEEGKKGIENTKRYESERERERRKTRGKSRTLRTIYVDLITLPVHLSSSAKKKKRKKNK